MSITSVQDAVLADTSQESGGSPSTAPRDPDDELDALGAIGLR
ncbi:MAG: hypothetical protein ACOCQY_01275 [Halorhabdus sp.]